MGINQGGTIMFGQRKCVGKEQLTGFSSSKALQDIPETAILAILQAETQTVRFWGNGDTPTAAVGLFLAPGDSIAWVGQLEDLKFIEEAATAKLNVSYHE